MMPHPNPFRTRSRRTRPRRLRRRLAALLLAGASALLAGCAGLGGAEAVEARAERLPTRGEVLRVVDGNGRERLVEGARRVDGHLLPDGRAYLQTAPGRPLRLLTREADFGEAFFARALALADDDSALVLVNRSGEGSELFRVAEHAPPRHIADLQALGVGEVAEESVALSPDGERLAFVATRTVALEPRAGDAEPAPGYADGTAEGEADGDATRMGLELAAFELALDRAEAGGAAADRAALRRVADSDALAARGFGVGAPPRLRFEGGEAEAARLRLDAPR